MTSVVFSYITRVDNEKVPKLTTADLFAGLKNTQYLSGYTVESKPLAVLRTSFLTDVVQTSPRRDFQICL